MKNGVILTVVGLVTIIGAVALFLLFLMGLETNANLVYFAGSLICLGIAIFCFIKATKPIEPVPGLELSIEPAEGGGQSRIQKNNEMVVQYNKTAKAREELRMMELAGSAGKE